MSVSRTPRQIQARDKTGEPARSRSPLPSREDALVSILGDKDPESPCGPPDGIGVALVGVQTSAIEQPVHEPRSPVESLAEELLGLGEYSPKACLDLLRLYARSKPEAHKRPLLDDSDPESIALSLGVYRL